MLIRIDVLARKRAKLAHWLDIIDLEILLILGLVLPFLLWKFFGIGWSGTWWLAPSYLVYMAFFKIGKPSGYAKHYFEFKFRPKAWSFWNSYRWHSRLFR